VRLVTDRTDRWMRTIVTSFPLAPAVALPPDSLASAILAPMEPQITLVIPSYERHPYLRRQLLYYADKPLHIVIADGSSVAWEDGDSGARGQMTWEYFHLPGFDTYTQRLQLAMERVSTEFMFLIDDQECILWTGVLRAIDHLRENPDHSCAGGRVAITAAGPGGLRLCPWKRWSDQWQLLDANPLARFQEMVIKERTANLYYQVHRTETIRRYSATFLDYRASYHSAGEVSLCSFTVLSGKWMMGSYPFWIRNGDSVEAPASAASPLSEDECRDMAERLMAATPTASRRSEKIEDLRFEAVDLELPIAAMWGLPQDRTEHDAASSIRDSFATALREARGRARALAAMLLWNLAPSLYSRMRSKHDLRFGYMTFGDYAIADRDGSPEVVDDLRKIEQIWTDFPNGVAARGSAIDG